MKLNVEPTVDIIFKVIFGTQKNLRVLRVFLNTILELKGENRIKRLEIKTPFNLEQYKEAKLSVVDIKAEDQLGRVFVVEMQVGSHTGLLQRILFGGISASYERLKKGEFYNQHRPIVCLWILTENLPPMLQHLVGFPPRKEEPSRRDTKARNVSDAVHLAFGMYDRVNECFLCENLTIHVIQLKHALKRGKIRSRKDQWLYFLKNGKDLDPEELPDDITVPEIRIAMESVLTFMQDPEARHMYLKRRDMMLEVRTRDRIYKEAEERAAEAEKRAVREKERAIQEKERADQEKERADQEKERADQEKGRADQEKGRAVQEKERADQEKGRAVQEKERADQAELRFKRLEEEFARFKSALKKQDEDS